MQAMWFSDAEIRSQISSGHLFRNPQVPEKAAQREEWAKSVTTSGQTRPKVQKKFEEALGRVLFMYRLAEGPFGKDDCLTKERYQSKILVILAVHDNDINHSTNQIPGSTSRLPETISFYRLPLRHYRDLLLQSLGARKLDTYELELSPTLDSKLLGLFGTLVQTPSWGDARDHDYQETTGTRVSTLPTTENAADGEDGPPEPKSANQIVRRHAGVTDEIWLQLQRDNVKAAMRTGRVASEGSRARTTGARRSA
ncbi:hypothetical protein F4678DRAFT_485492 [Xylaria arbuscula]|nr:hypothetical protein F4678DRAFT_485492 [Xylaria arbuscula]